MSKNQAAEVKETEMAAVKLEGGEETAEAPKKKGTGNKGIDAKMEKHA